MPDLIANVRTARSDTEVIAGARDFFTADNWRETRRGPRTVTFRGRPHIPWYLMVLIAVALLAYVVPGVVLYLICTRHICRFTSIVVTTTPVHGGAEVVIQHAGIATGIASEFIARLPPLEAQPLTPHPAEALPGLELGFTESGRA
jgi:hypothetical protein